MFLELLSAKPLTAVSFAFRDSWFRAHGRRIARSRPWSRRSA